MEQLGVVSDVVAGHGADEDDCILTLVERRFEQQVMLGLSTEGSALLRN